MPLNGSRQADIGRLVRNLERAVRRHEDLIHAGEGGDVGAVIGGDDRGRVTAGLVDDQVGNDARLRVEHHVAGGAGLVGAGGHARDPGAEEVRGHAFGVVEDAGDEPRHDVVGGPHPLHARQQAVPGAVDRAQAVRQQGTADQLTQLVAVDRAVRVAGVFRELDLREDKVQVIKIDVEVVLILRHIISPKRIWTSLVRY
jgi:hypothetical protein